MQQKAYSKDDESGLGNYRGFAGLSPESRRALGARPKAFGNSGGLSDAPELSPWYKEPEKELNKEPEIQPALAFKQGVLNNNTHIVRMSMLAKPLWYVATTATIQNLDPEVFYVLMDSATRKSGTDLGASQVSARVEGDKFQDFMVKLLHFTQWRVANGHRSVVVLDPPPINHITHWELTLAKVGCNVAWVDSDSCARESAFRLDPTEFIEGPHVSHPHHDGSVFWNSCMLLRSGETLTFRPTQKTLNKDSLKMFLVRYRNAIQRINKACADRQFLIHWFSNSRTVCVRRMDEMEYQAWLINQKKKLELKKLGQ